MVGDYNPVRKDMINNLKELQDEPTRIITSVLSWISGLSLLIVGLSTLYNKRLNRFPYTLFAWATLYESLMYFNYSS